MDTYFLVSAGVGVSVTFPDWVGPVTARRPDLLSLATRRLDIPAESLFFAWQPHYPSRIWPRQPLSMGIRVGVDTAASLHAARAPTSWLPVYPVWIARRVLATALRPAYFLPPLGALMQVGVQMGWSPRYPDPRPRSRYDQIRSGLVSPLTTVSAPPVFAAGEPCVEFANVTVALPTFVSAVTTRPIFLTPGLTRTTFLSGAFC
jgi:hypothetical protein